MVKLTHRARFDVQSLNEKPGKFERSDALK